MKTSYDGIYRNIAALLDAGLDLKKALRSGVVKEKGVLHDAIIATANSIDRGSTLAWALSRHPKVFPPSDRSMIGIGEESGRLPEAFRALADWYKVKAQIWRIFGTGLIRPALSIHLAAFILPLPKLFAGPAWGGYFLSVVSFLMIFYVPTAAIILLYRWSGKRGGFRVLIDRVLSGVPILGSALRDIALARYCHGFWTLFASGLPMQKCAEMAADLTGNAVVSPWVDGGGESVRKGKPVSAGFSPVIPRDFLALWSVGEESGRLEETVQHLYKKYFEQGEFHLKKFFRWLPRIIYAFVFIFIMYRMFSNFAIFGDKI